MLIDKIKSFGQSPEVKKTSPLKGSDSVSSNDKISISPAAKEISQENKLISDVKQFTLSALSMEEDSSRVEKLREVKERLKRGDYDVISDEMAEISAEKILDSIMEK
jgi:hypothetical protein